MEKIRLQKFISECGLMSRRAAEAEIAKGNFTVNGITATVGDKVDPECDVVMYNGKTVEYKNSGDDPRRSTYIVLNKPIGYVTTMSDEQGRKTVRDLLSDVGKRVYPVGRLDMYSDGLLICTNDGDLTNKITHPSHSIPKKYLATLTSHLTDENIRDLAVPFELEGYMLRPFEVELIEYTKTSAGDSTVVQFTLHEGRNREIRNICTHHGYKLTRLTRISVGEITLDGLASGKWRHLTEEEIEYLKSI
ncbi:MAG: rRNA pseudouridine synthase [Ruminococcaceae bacterium]|nr:rRNA pseudouridine synthase [Oscillospiraceae bacterium]